VTAVDQPGRAELLGMLLRHEVKFVVIGGAAIQSHGRAYDTQDIDVTPETDEANLQRVADALNALECRLVADPADPRSWVALPADYFTPGRSWRLPSGTLRRATVCST
jgi:hypothetical protein